MWGWMLNPICGCGWPIELEADSMRILETQESPRFGYLMWDKYLWVSDGMMWNHHKKNCVNIGEKKGKITWNPSRTGCKWTTSRWLVVGLLPACRPSSRWKGVDLFWTCRSPWNAAPWMGGLSWCSCREGRSFLLCAGACFPFYPLGTSMWRTVSGLVETTMSPSVAKPLGHTGICWNYSKTG